MKRGKRGIVIGKGMISGGGLEGGYMYVYDR